MQLRVGRIGRPHGLDGSFYVVEPDPALPGGDGVVFVARRRAPRGPALRHERAPDPAPGGLVVARRRPGPARQRADDPAHRGAAGGGRVLGVRPRGLRGRRRRRHDRLRAPDERAALASRCWRSTASTAPSCSCRWCATASARSTSRRAGSTSTWASSVKADVFTLFPQWFDWFRTQRHVENALALGHSVEAVDFRASTPLKLGAGGRRAVRRRRRDGAARGRHGGGAARSLRGRPGHVAVVRGA